MLVRPSDTADGLFIDLMRIDAVIPDDSDDFYAVVFTSGARQQVSLDVGIAILEELAKKRAVSA